MSKKLVIVESPAKAKTIEKYLGKKYIVKSSVGHVRDLSKSGPGRLGVDIENNFKPKYTVKKEKKNVVKDLKDIIKKKKFDEIYLATDPDREGEAISWHLYDTLNLEKLENTEVKRIVFNEITKNAILSAIGNPRDIDNDLVKSQESRRILDRIIGFKLSRLLQSKIKSKSAGRVQSVALKLIVDREKEIQAFNSEEYWRIKAVFEKGEQDFTAELSKYKDNKVEIKNEEEALNIVNNLTNDYIITHIKTTERKKNPQPPFITSTMQRLSSNKLYFSAKKTMTIAQKLYEGIEIESGLTGLITYMRTDSTRLSNEFLSDAYQYIENVYGKENVGKLNSKNKTKNVQDAHEAIRPTDINNTPEKIKKYLTKDQYKLYKLIWSRTVAALMHHALFMQTAVDINNDDYLFKTSGQVLVSKGYLEVYGEYETFKNEMLPKLEAQEKLNCTEVLKSQHFTQPPARFTEAKLIKTMEELGIGRPSTYALTIDTIQSRGYVQLEEKRFIPTEQGVLTSDKLDEFFKSIINIEYTAKMEETLDAISKGQVVWHEELKSFYDDFSPLLEEAMEKMEKIAPVETGELCPECGEPLVIRKGRYGDFVACSGFPKCRYVKKEEKEEKPKSTGIKCPKCGNGEIVERVSKKGRNKGKVFYACSNYPECKNPISHEPIDELCPECGSLLMKTQDKIRCSDLKCKYVKETFNT